MSNVVFYYKKGQLKVKNNEINLKICGKQSRVTVAGSTKQSDPNAFGLFNNLLGCNGTNVNGITGVTCVSNLRELLKGIKPTKTAPKNLWIFCNNRCDKNGPVGYCFNMSESPSVKQHNSKIIVKIPITKSTKKTQLLNNSSGWIMLDNSSQSGCRCYGCGAMACGSTVVYGCNNCPSYDPDKKCSKCASPP